MDSQPTNTPSSSEDVRHSVEPSPLEEDLSALSVPHLDLPSQVADEEYQSPEELEIKSHLIEVSRGALRIDGRPTYLYGADLHYFRVRDRDYDPLKTYAIWGDSLDKMKAAGMNMVSTYVPWDYHNTTDGVYDFSGARDLQRFITMAIERDLYVILKPGPLITAEWPRGFGSFGAVPEWWKKDHPEAMVKDRNGKPWSYSPWKDPRQQQPSYLHPTYLDAVDGWYDAFSSVARPFIGKGLVAIQIDNETNGYWANRYGDFDYSEVSVAHYRAWLEEKYSSIQALNAAYNTKHTTFEEVKPPGKSPRIFLGDRAENRWLADWYEAGQAYIEDYLKLLRGMLEQKGFHEPDLLFFTNDSPFTLQWENVPLKDVLLHHGPMKNGVGLAGMDLYPKQFTTNPYLQDQPFQADYFTRVFAVYAQVAQGKEDFVYAAELQGGFYDYPFIGHPSVPPEATDQLLARTIGRGLKGGSFYVMRDGLNADNSPYNYLAALDKDGNPSPRYEVLQRWGKFLQKHSDSLIEAKEVMNSVAIVIDSSYGAPQAGVADHVQRMQTIDNPAIFGWLTAAGINPHVVDACHTTAEELSKYKVVLFQNPDFLRESTAELLLKYVSEGGVLIDLLWPGRVNESFQVSDAIKAFSKLFPAYQVTPGPLWNPFQGQMKGVGPTGEEGIVPQVWYHSQWRCESTAKCEPILRAEKGLPFDREKMVGYTLKDDIAVRAFIGANIFGVFNMKAYYAMSDTEIKGTTNLARHLIALGGESPILSADRPRQLVWSRRTSDKLFLFAVNDNERDDVIHINLHQGERLGIDPTKVYMVTEELNDSVLMAGVTGAMLLSDGIQLPVEKLRSAVLLITECPIPGIPLLGVSPEEGEVKEDPRVGAAEV